MKTTAQVELTHKMNLSEGGWDGPDWRSVVITAESEGYGKILEINLTAEQLMELILGGSINNITVKWLYRDNDDLE